MNDILDEIMMLYASNDVELIQTSRLSPDAPDVADLKKRRVVINKNSRWNHQYIFRLTHEIFHFIEKTDTSSRLVAYHGYDVRNDAEALANQSAIKWLLVKYNGMTDTPNWLEFMDWFGLPSFLENEVKCQMNKDVTI